MQASQHAHIQPVGLLPKIKPSFKGRAEDIGIQNSLGRWTEVDEIVVVVLPLPFQADMHIRNRSSTGSLVIAIQTSISLPLIRFRCHLRTRTWHLWNPLNDDSD